MAEIIPNLPGGFTAVACPPFPNPYLTRLAAISWRFGKSQRAVWTADDSDSPMKLVEAVIQPFATEQAAEQTWRANRPDPQTMMSLVEPSPEAYLSDSELTMRWRRGPIFFTEIAGQYGRAVIDVMVARTDSEDATAFLRGMVDDIRGQVDAMPGHWSRGIPNVLWQGLVGVAPFFSIVVAGTLILRPLVVGTLANLLTIAVIVSLVTYDWLLPKLRRKQRLREHWRKGLLNGGPDSVVRDSLASIGVQLPPEPSTI
jgi:hypothetical protein